MSPLEQDAVFPVDVRNGTASAHERSGAAPRHTETQWEPELESSGYQSAPITSLVLARWPWLIVGALLGIVLGVFASTGGGYFATSTIRVSAGSTDPKVAGQSTERLVGTAAVINAAAQALHESPEALSGRIKGLWELDTNLVNITSSNPDPQAAIGEANAVAAAMVAQVQAQSQADFEAARRAGNKLITDGQLSNHAAEVAREAAVVPLIAQKQLAAVDTASSLAVAQQASFASPSGTSRSVSMLLGAAGGVFLGALGAVVAGAGRRRPHSQRELLALAPDLTVRTTVQAGELAGRVMDTGRNCLVVLGLPDTRFAATQLGMAIAHHLRTHGATVALIDRIADFSAGSGNEERLWALRRDVRRDIGMHFSAEFLVVVAAADEEALSLIAGQGDLTVVVVAKQRKTSLSDIRRTIEAVEASEPVVVLSR